MCGIVGLVQKGAVNKQTLIAMRDRLTHRGPNDSGLWISDDSRVGLGHRRLSIVDLSAAGHQPMVSQEGRYIIVFNGEIYNYRELKAELKEKGFLFNSDSDTEVILTAYIAWGESCLDRFNGMFAFVIYDHGDHDFGANLFFARDRVGKKPFYYFYDGNSFEFASELKAINQDGDVSIDAINSYLALGYIPGDQCFIEGVKKLPPAHSGRLYLNSMELTLKRYWNLPHIDARENISGDQLADDIESLLIDSVSMRMVSDVPLGILLSGGLDSSIIAAIAARCSPVPIKTFTLSLPGSKLDEASYAKCVSDYLHTDHHVLEIDAPSIANIEDIAQFIDEPLADSSLIPSYLISKLTREHVTVVLGGDGGDELFGGYSNYLLSLRMKMYLRYVPNILIRFVSKLASYLPAGMRGRNFLASLAGGPLQQQIWGTSYFDIALRKRLLSSKKVSELGCKLDAPEQMLLGFFKEGDEPLDSMTRQDFFSILPDDFLVKVDRSTMAVSLEGRTPFLDYRLVEFAFSKIPSSWKISGGESRRIERLLAKRLLPTQLNTKRKQGFSIPLDEWMRSDNCMVLRKYLKYLPEFINRDEIESLILGLFKGRANGARLYSLLVLGIAMKNRIDIKEIQFE